MVRYAALTEGEAARVTPGLIRKLRFFDPRGPGSLVAATSIVGIARGELCGHDLLPGGRRTIEQVVAAFPRDGEFREKAREAIQRGLTAATAVMDDRAQPRYFGTRTEFIDYCLTGDGDWLEDDPAVQFNPGQVPEQGMDNLSAFWESALLTSGHWQERSPSSGPATPGQGPRAVERALGPGGLYILMQTAHNRLDSLGSGSAGLVMGAMAALHGEPSNFMTRHGSAAIDRVLDPFMYRGDVHGALRSEIHSACSTVWRQMQDQALVESNDCLLGLRAFALEPFRFRAAHRPADYYADAADYYADAAMPTRPVVSNQTEEERRACRDAGKLWMLCLQLSSLPESRWAAQLSRLPRARADQQ